jgi:hypothetical protein
VEVPRHVAPFAQPARYRIDFWCAQARAQMKKSEIRRNQAICRSSNPEGSVPVPPVDDDVADASRTSVGCWMGPVRRRGVAPGRSHSGSRVGDRDNRREDDLLDTFCYGIALALENEKGF